MMECGLGVLSIGDRVITVWDLMIRYDKKSGAFGSGSTTIQ